MKKNYNSNMNRITKEYVLDKLKEKGYSDIESKDILYNKSKTLTQKERDELVKNILIEMLSNITITNRY